MSEVVRCMDEIDADREMGAAVIIGAGCNLAFATDIRIQLRRRAVARPA
jgi:hypothetical protein